jgi:DNA-binding transcriptional LysR family regulator
MWRTVELRELRLFLALAEELHFGRTAERLQITPSRVSQSLRSLEQKLGTTLVHRTSRRVRLTPSGESFLRDVRPAVGRLDDVLESSDADAGGLAGTLKLGLFSGPAGGPHLGEITREFAARHPECDVEIVQLSWDDPFGRLRDGDVDVMASWVPLKQPDLVVGPTLTRQPRVLAVGRDHRLAGEEKVSAEELAEERVPRFEKWPRELHDAVVPFRTPGGRQIRGARIRIGERAILDIAVRIGRGEIVFPTVPTAEPYMGELDLAFVPLTGLRPLSSALVWRRPARDPRLREFTRVAREVLRGAKKPA